MRRNWKHFEFEYTCFQTDFETKLYGRTLPWPSQCFRVISQGLSGIPARKPDTGTGPGSASDRSLRGPRVDL